MGFFDNFGWLLGFIPLWVYVVIAVVVLALTAQFWTPIFAALPRPVQVGLLFVGGLFAAVIYGRYRGASLERAKVAEREANALAKRQEINRKVDNQTASETHTQLSRWNRRDE